VYQSFSFLFPWCLVLSGPCSCFLIGRWARWCGSVSSVDLLPPVRSVLTYVRLGPGSAELPRSRAATGCSWTAQAGGWETGSCRAGYGCAVVVHAALLRPKSVVWFTNERSSPRIDWRCKALHLMCFARRPRWVDVPGARSLTPRTRGALTFVLFVVPFFGGGLFSDSPCFNCEESWGGLGFPT
jgi:hypothetical protein